MHKVTNLTLCTLGALSSFAHTGGHHDAKIVDETISHPAHDIRIEVTDGPNPWTNQPFLNDPRNFQFAVISDNTGGMRPGIVEIAVDKLNLLQPEFVMSVGDLIEGYTKDLDRLNFEWDEFNEKIDPLEMRFFYVPGNHDMTNHVMAKLWEERFGRAYYHFVYNDVLFLCLNTEDTHKETISPTQIAWVEEILADHADVRWTMVFMHKPLWQYEMNRARRGETDKTTGWPEVEAFLKDRKHTVLCGHYHRYAHYEINDSDYIILSTTGGGSQVRGAEYGEIDQIAWITMTDDGPTISNIEIAGILPKDFAKPEAGTFIYETLRVLKVAISPYYTNEGTLPAEYETSIAIQNNGKSDVSLEFEMPEINGLQLTADTSKVTLNAGTETAIPLTIRSVSGQGIVLATSIEIPYTITASLENEVDVAFVEKVSLSIAPIYSTEPDADWVTVDAPVSITGNSDAWTGADDGYLRFKVKRTDESVVIEAVAFDDKLIPPSSTEDAWIGDGIELRVSPILDPMRSIETTRFWQDQNKNYFAMYLVPDVPVRSYSYNYGAKIPEGIVAKCSSEGEGTFSAKVTIPISVLDEFVDGKAEQFRFSIGLNDRDIEGEIPAQLWWPEDWRSAKMKIGSGTFEL